MTHPIVSEEMVSKAADRVRGESEASKRFEADVWVEGFSEDFARAALEAVLPEYAAEAKALRLGHVQGYVGRRIDEREGDVTDAQIAEWEQRAGDHWDRTYPHLAGLARGAS